MPPVPRVIRYKLRDGISRKSLLRKLFSVNEVITFMMIVITYSK